jgi:hypothetical protein
MKATARSPIRPKVASKPGVLVVVVDLVVVVGSVVGFEVVVVDLMASGPRAELVVVDLVMSGLEGMLVEVVVDFVASAGTG